MKGEDKSSKRQKIIVYFIAFIMISSIAGFIIGGQNPTNKAYYNSYKFVFKGNAWVTDINKKEATFNYFPTDVIDINISKDIIDRLANTLEIDVTSDINSTFANEIALAQYEMNLELGFHLNKFIMAGFTGNNSFDKPIITCTNSTSLIPVIYFVEANETKVGIIDNCIIAEANYPYDVIRIKDRLLYGIYGIIG